MARDTCQVITLTFKALCYITAIGVISFWLYKCYVLDDDLCLVDYYPIDSKEFEAPVLSICFNNPISDEKLNKINPSFNATYYLEYLKGRVTDEHLMKVDYEEVSLNISQHITGYEVHLNNGSRLRYEYGLSPYQNPIHVTYSGFFLGLDANFVKCFGHSVRQEYRKEVMSITTNYNFPSGFGKHYVSVHYPNQLLASVKNFKFFVNPIFDPKKMISTRWFNVKEMEVLKRRNKPKYHCLDFNDNFSFDKHVQLSHENKKPLCQAPYQDLDKSLPICSTMEDMKKAAFVFNEDFDEKIHPCDSMSNIRHEMEELFLPFKKVSAIVLAIPKKVRVIQQSKAIDTNSLIGYVGGYVGVLLGKCYKNECRKYLFNEYQYDYSLH